MTGLLTDLMHERADDLGAPDLDLAEITGDGDRRVRRRRTAIAGGLAAAAAVAAVTVPSLLAGGGAPGRGTVADGTDADPHAVSWVTGSTLHREGQPDVDLGVHVRAWVWVGVDIVYTDQQHRVRLWTGDALEVIGRTAAVEADDPELVSDGSFVAWVSEDGRVVRYDASAGTTLLAPVLPGRHPRVTAIDGAQVYATDSEGVYAWQPSAPDAYEVLSGDLGAVIDAENGTTVRQVDGGNRAVLTRNGEMVQLSTDAFANLSPDGLLVATEADDAGEVVDARTGERMAFDHGHEWALGYSWLDADTLAVLAFDGIDDDSARTATLLTCDGRTGVCDDSGTDIPAGYGDFQLPIGIHVE